jgi:hypothetical protein
VVDAVQPDHAVTGSSWRNRVMAPWGTASTKASWSERSMWLRVWGMSYASI